MVKRIYKFGPDHADGDGSMKELLGGKGAALAEMSRHGVRVPPGFTITTNEHKNYMNGLGKLDLIMKSVSTTHLSFLKKHFGYTPLVSVRSGAPVSMPGMMDTILNVGLSRANLDEWSGRIGRRAALDCYRRLLEMYSTTVHKLPMEDFDADLQDLMKARGVSREQELPADDLDELCVRYEGHYEVEVGNPFPESVQAQIRGAIGAVWRSWMTPRAIEYRKNNNISEEMGTACTVQAMVFGNVNDESCSGVFFTRNPSNGDDELVGEFLPNAQGEDVVAGTRTPLSMSGMPEWNKAVYAELAAVGKRLEGLYGDVQDIEFTVQDGVPWILQTRSAKRTAHAAFKIASDLIDEGLATHADVKGMLTRDQYKVLRKRQIAASFTQPPDLCGLGAGGGVVVGEATFDPDDCGPGKIFIAMETSPDDYASMVAASGFLTSRGGITSHAAVVARSLDKPAVVGADGLLIVGHKAKVDGTDTMIKPGTRITMDGNTGKVWFGVHAPLEDPDPSLMNAVRGMARTTVETATRYTPVAGGGGLVIDDGTASTIMVDLCHVEASDIDCLHVIERVIDWLGGDADRKAFLNCNSYGRWSDVCGLAANTSDYDLASVIGLSSKTYREVANRVKVEALNSVPEAFRARIVLIGGGAGHAVYDGPNLNEGFMVAQTITKVIELLDVDYCFLSPTFKQDNQLTDSDLERLVSILRKGGATVGTVPNKMYGDQIVFTWLS